VDGWQLFPLAFAIATVSDADKRLEHLNTLYSRLEELEQHLATTSQPYFGGLNLDDDSLIITKVMIRLVSK